MNKLFITILILFFAMEGFAQAYYNDPIYNSLQSTWWNALTHAPADTSIKKPLIIFIPGQGEVGSDTAKAALYGPLYQFRNGVWDGTVNGEDCWIVHLQPSGSSRTQALHNYALNELIARHPSVDTCRIYLTGLSFGGAIVTNQIGNSTASYSPWHFAAVVAMSVGDYASTNGNIPAAAATNWLQAGGRWYGLIGNSDTRPQTENYSDSFNIAVAGSAQYFEYTGGHSGWQAQYNPNTRNMNGENVYEYLFKHSQRPYANVAASVINTTDTSTTLLGIADSIATGHNGWNRMITWTQVSGASAIIVSPNNASTNITGLSVGTSVFKITIANASGGLVATKDVTVNVTDGSSTWQGYIMSKKKYQRFIIN